MRSLVLVILAIVGISSAADAQSSHERVEIKPLTQGGETIGIKLKLTLKPKPSRDGTIVRIGLGRNNWMAFSQAKATTDHRKAASDMSFGYAVYQREITDITTEEPREVTLEIPYADMPGFTPGDSVDVFTAWSRGDAHNIWHVWGVNGSFNGVNDKLVFKTPAGKAIVSTKTPKASMVVMSQRGPVTVDLSSPIFPTAPAAPKIAKAPKAKLQTVQSKVAAAAKPTATSQVKAASARKAPAKGKVKNGGKI